MRIELFKGSEGLCFLCDKIEMGRYLIETDTGCPVTICIRCYEELKRYMKEDK